MTLQVEFWELVGLVVTLFVGVLGAFVAMGKALLGQMQRHIDMRFEALGATSATTDGQIMKRLDAIDTARHEDATHRQRIEHDLLTLKADLPINYVRREDYVQSMATIMTKLDAMSLRFENILLKGGRNHE